MHHGSGSTIGIGVGLLGLGALVFGTAFGTSIGSGGCTPSASAAPIRPTVTAASPYEPPGLAQSIPGVAQPARNVAQSAASRTQSAASRTQSAPARAQSMATADGQTPAPDDSLMPLVVWKGPESRVEQPDHVRIESAEDWKALWNRHAGLKAQVGGYHPQVPRVDFKRCTVIAIFGGRAWNCNGYYAVSVTDQGDTVRFRYDAHTYQTSGPDGGGVKVRPFAVFVLPRIDKPIILEENVQGLIGKPPKWKAQARLD